MLKVGTPNSCRNAALSDASPFVATNTAWTNRCHRIILLKLNRWEQVEANYKAPDLRHDGANKLGDLNYGWVAVRATHLSHGQIDIWVRVSMLT